MCLNLGGSPQPLPPPPPPVAPPEPPKPADPAQRQAKTSAKRIAARAQGRQGTLLGGALKSDPQNQPGKTLLGS